MPLSRRARWAAAAIGAAAVVGVVGSIDQGSLVRTVMPARRPRGHVPTGWASDLDFLRDVVQRNELGATSAQVAEFTRRLDVPAPDSVDQLSLVVSHALASFDNAHTCALHPKFHRVPLRFGWTADALVVMQTRASHAHLLGHRVVSIGGGQPDVTWPLFARFVGGGTEAWLRHRAALFLSVPAALRAVGLAGLGPIVLDTESHTGERVITRVDADAEASRCDTFRDFWTRIPGRAAPGWLDVLSLDEDLPRYLRDGDSRLLLDEIPEADALYLLMRGCVSDPDQPLDDFHDEVMERATSRPWQRFVVDFRHNTGGDYLQALPLVKDLCAEARRANTAIRLIVGPNTFSAGLVAATQFTHWAPERTTVIGGQVGDRLHFRAEGRVIALPWSGVEVYLARDAHDLRTTQNPWNDVWLPDKFLLHGVDTFEPDIMAVNGWDDYLGLRDRVLEAALGD